MHPFRPHRVDGALYRSDRIRRRLHGPAACTGPRSGTDHGRIARRDSGTEGIRSD